MKMTNLEIIVYNALIDICFDEHSATAIDVGKLTGLETNVVKGAVGSLTNKGMVATGDGINPIVDGNIFRFGLDNYEEDELDRLKLS